MLPRITFTKCGDEYLLVRTLPDGSKRVFSQSDDVEAVGEGATLKEAIADFLTKYSPDEELERSDFDEHNTLNHAQQGLAR